MSNRPRKSGPISFVTLKAWEVNPETGCWNWLGAVNRHGYGTEHAHRRVYREYVGEIPAGHHLHHICENQSCVNPEHLAPLTPVEHERLHWRKRTKISPETLAEIKRQARETLRPAREIAAELDVNVWSVHRIINGSRWGEPGEDLRPVRTCPECGVDFKGKTRKVRYCCPDHARQFNARKRAERQRQQRAA